MKPFSFREIWNNAAQYNKTRPIEPRSYLYASELGGSVFDTWMKLNGEKPTTPPNPRSFRKFNAGHTWEWMVKMTLIQAGVLKADQRNVAIEGTDNRLGVHGRTDFIIAPSSSLLDITDILGELPEYLQVFIKDLSAPQEFEETIFECKSISSMLFPKRELDAAPNHKLQLYHYMKGLGLLGMICYISKDDCLMAEHYINPKDCEADYNAWVENISGYYFNNERPPLEPLILKDDKFSKNWMVEYSSFLTEYGFDTPEEYRNSVDSKISRWNRVLKRIENGDKMTDNNLEAIEEIKKEGYELPAIY